MRRLGRGLVRGTLTGTVVGLLILGIGGRLVMSLIAWRAGIPVGYTVGGTLEVIMTGVLFGLGGGLIYATLVAVARSDRPAVGAAFGALYFAALVLYPPPAARSAAAGVPQQRVLVLLAFGALFVAYGVTLAALMRRARSMI
jgi:ABC-type polysaccharide/polyol phosphate export permease